MASTPMRSFIKGVVWETVSFILTTFAVYLIYGNFLNSLKFGLALTAVKMMLFFIHERIWKKIRWGKYHVIDGKVIVECNNKYRKRKIINSINKKIKKEKLSR